MLQLNSPPTLSLHPTHAISNIIYFDLTSGVLIYLLYGIWHSKERRLPDDDIAMRSEKQPISATKSFFKKPCVTKEARIVDGIDGAKPFYWEVEVPILTSEC